MPQHKASLATARELLTQLQKCTEIHFVVGDADYSMLSSLEVSTIQAGLMELLRSSPSGEGGRFVVELAPSQVWIIATALQAVPSGHKDFQNAATLAAFQGLSDQFRRMLDFVPKSH
jgi:hypothetical protein